MKSLNNSFSARTVRTRTGVTYEIWPGLTLRNQHGSYFTVVKIIGEHVYWHMKGSKIINVNPISDNWTPLYEES